MATTATKAAWLLLTLLLLIPAAAYAQGNCEPAQAESVLDVNNVRASIFNNGALFWQGGQPLYEVPKGGGASAIFAASLWVGGQVDGQLRMAAARYSTYQFWPGPLNPNGTLPNPDDCSAFDRIYKVSLRDLIDYDQTGTASQDLLDWPFDLGAPVIDGDGNPDNYNLQGGDRPEVLGHQTLWWVMNDAGNQHLAPSPATPPLKLEAQVSAFAAAAGVPAIDNATLYRYTLIYRGDAPLENAYIGFFVDADLGNFDDDYVGADTSLGFGYVYNSDNNDEGGGGYGANPPALGLGLVQGPDVDGQRLGMTSFMSHDNGGCVTCDPQNASDYYNYMQALWKDGMHATVGGDGRNFSARPTNFMFPGNPEDGAFWSEVNADSAGLANAPADRRFIISSGPFTMQPGDEQEVVFAITWARGADNLASVGVLRQVTRAVQDAFAAGFDFALVPAPTQAAELRAPADGADKQPTNPTLTWSPVTGADQYQVQVSTDDTFAAGVHEFLATEQSTAAEGLSADSTYFWRVRGANPGGFAPWSETWRFSTADIALIAGGVLTFDDGSPAFVEVVGPGGVDPCGPEAGSTFGCDEVGGNNVWVSFNSTNEYILSSPSIGPEQRIGAFAPNDFELRVTQQGSYAYHPFTTGAGIWAPVEVWDIGPTGPFNENDTADDVQMIVNLFSDSQAPEGECFFGYGEGELFGRPFSDRVYAYYPIAGSSYEDYETLMKPLVDADPSGCPTDPATADASNLIDFGRDRPIQRVVFIDNTAGAKDVADLHGTVVRFYTSPIAMSAPVPSSPRDRAVSLPFSVRLWWNAPPGASRYHLQVSGNADFTALIMNDSTLTLPSALVLNVPAAGSYYWRVRAANDLGAQSEWSAVWAFTVGTAVAVAEPDAGIPTTFQLRPNYPNPFNPATTIRFGLPTASRVSVTIYDALGRRVAALVEDQLAAGWYTVPWEAVGMSSGVYFYRIEAGTFRQTQTMVLMR